MRDTLEGVPHPGTSTQFSRAEVTSKPAEPGTSTQNRTGTAEKARQPGISTQDPTAEMAPHPGTSTQRPASHYTGEVVPSNWVVVRVHLDKSKTLKYRYFIAVVVKVESEIRVRFLKHVKGTCHTFVNPEIDDYSDVDKEDIIKVLPEPTLDNKCRMIFDVDVNLWPK